MEINVIMVGSDFIVILNHLVKSLLKKGKTGRFLSTKTFELTNDPEERYPYHDLFILLPWYREMMMKRFRDSVVPKNLLGELLKPVMVSNLAEGREGDYISTVTFELEENPREDGTSIPIKNLFEIY